LTAGGLQLHLHYLEELIGHLFFDIEN